MQLLPAVNIFFLKVLFSLNPVRLEVSWATRYLSRQQTAKDEMISHPGLTMDFCIST